ncbi:MAG: DUF2905 domain-containing protein [Deltaproteobacteria bacterium]|nr:DUF2905 domain-containing protein [Deltaproteobacteria bacterium]MCL5893137.1 DUF2905 domain-containing protein [Deltaproteobacteria bacterium]
MLQAGIVLIISGIIFVFYPKLHLGRFPGDIIIRKGNFTFYFPLGLSIAISVILTIILYIISRH